MLVLMDRPFFLWWQHSSLSSPELLISKESHLCFKAITWVGMRGKALQTDISQSINPLPEKGMPINFTSTPGLLCPLQELLGSTNNQTTCLHLQVKFIEPVCIYAPGTTNVTKFLLEELCVNQSACLPLRYPHIDSHHSNMTVYWGSGVIYYFSSCRTEGGKEDVCFFWELQQLRGSDTVWITLFVISDRSDQREHWLALGNLTIFPRFQAWKMLRLLLVDFKGL